MKLFCNCECATKLVKFYADLFGFELTVEKCDCCKDGVVLQDGEQQVWEMPCIIRYLGQKAKCPCYFKRDLAQQTKVDEAIQWADALYKQMCEIYTLISAEATAIFHSGYAKSLLEKVMQHLTCIEGFFSQNTFFVSERISLADFYMVYALACATTIISKADQAKYINIVRYINTICAQFPAMAKIAEIKFAETPFVMKAFKVEKPKEEKKEEPAKKEKKAEEEGNDEPKAPQAPAIKYNYTFDMNAWKRHYKNLDWENKEDWQPYFYEHFKQEEMSLWIIDYKEPAAFKEDWKTKNLIGILLQRLRGEKADQNSFGNFLVVKNEAEPNFNILGVFLMPGKEVMKEYAETSGTQSFNFTRIDDIEKPEVKEFVRRNWNWSEEEDMIYHGKNYGKCSDGNGETFV